MEWFKIRSWHALRLTRSIEPRSLCGRIGTRDAEWSNTLPSEKSCETCLRIVARKADGG
jgi:hypothetical protein